MNSDDASSQRSQVSRAESQFSFDESRDTFEVEAIPLSPARAPLGRAGSKMSLADFTRSASAIDQYSLGRKYSVYDDQEEKKDDSGDDKEIELTAEKIDSLS